MYKRQEHRSKMNRNCTVSLKINQCGVSSVSYTHLDVYKRQVYSGAIAKLKVQPSPTSTQYRNNLVFIKQCTIACSQCDPSVHLREFSKEFTRPIQIFVKFLLYTLAFLWMHKIFVSPGLSLFLIYIHLKTILLSAKKY